MPQPSRAEASHNRWGWFNGQGGPFGAQVLLMHPSQHAAVWSHTWNAGRHAPGVTLALGFDAPVTELRLCPSMQPAEGVVGLVVVLPESAERIAHRARWREGEWVTIALPTPSSQLRLEFVESPSWIALHAVEARSSGI